MLSPKRAARRSNLSPFEVGGAPFARMLAAALSRNHSNGMDNIMNAPITGKVLPDMSDLMKRLAALEARNSELENKLAAKRSISFKVQEKGTLSIYGLQRFPITAYAAQWLAILDKSAELKKFIEDNRETLAWKE